MVHHMRDVRHLRFRMKVSKVGCVAVLHGVTLPVLGCDILKRGERQSSQPPVSVDSIVIE